MIFSSHGDMQFQSTPPVRVATGLVFLGDGRGHIISIHATREGGDGRDDPARRLVFSISIHATREGGDAGSLRVLIQQAISIHATREGGDHVVLLCHRYVLVFQSTPPVRVAT